MRTWFDRTIEAGLIGLGVFSVIEAARILIAINHL